MTKKIIFVGWILLMSISCVGSKRALKNTAFIANIGSICEETPDDNLCAGQESYLLLMFGEDSVQVMEKEVSTCGVEDIYNKLHCKWNQQSNGKIELFINTKDLENSYLRNLDLRIVEKQLIGVKQRGKIREKIMFKTIEK